MTRGDKGKLSCPFFSFLYLLSPYSARLCAPCAWRDKMFNVSLFTLGMVLGIVNSFSWIFNVISSEKSCQIPMLFLLTYIDVRTVKFFLPANSWLVDSKFQTRQLYARVLFKLLRFPIWFRLKAGVHVKAVLTLLNTAFLTISRSRFKQR